MDEALREWAAALGGDAVATGGALGPWLENVSGFSRRVPCALRPRSTAEVVETVRIANRHGIPLHPVSLGCNWGMGSRLPVRDGAAIVDLGRMDRIREICGPGRYAVIEPGVTQAQLYRRLREENLPLVFNVTGSGENTSVLGNSLDRGVGYFDSRAGALSGLEVVLGNGEVLRTGFGHRPDARTVHLYRHGIGPSLDGLFQQGNFGIVTAAGFELLPEPESDVALIARLAREEDLPELIVALAGLRRQGAIEHVAHVGNRERSWIALAPLLFRELEALRAVPAGRDPRAFTERILRNEGFGPWSAVAAVPGTGARQRWARRRIRRELRRLARLSFIGHAQLRIADALLSRMQPLGWARRKLALLRSVKPVHRLAKGVPTDVALQSVYWPVPGQFPSAADDPDRSGAGLLYCLPLLPADPESVRSCVSGARDIFARHGFEPAMTLNLLDDRSLEGVFSLAFPRSDSARAAAARACIREAEAFFLRSGWPPYRVGIESMDLVVDPGSPYWQTVRRLKQALDPNGIIAPGRYNPA